MVSSNIIKFAPKNWAPLPHTTHLSNLKKVALFKNGDQKRATDHIFFKTSNFKLRIIRRGSAHFF